MSIDTRHSSRWIRFCINTGFVLVLISAVFARASAVTLEKPNGKVIQPAFSELKCATNGIDSDSPEPKAATAQLERLIASAVPQVLGQAHHQQYSPMVLQLRDRLMHAPPATL